MIINNVLFNLFAIPFSALASQAITITYTFNWVILHLDSAFP